MRHAVGREFGFVMITVGIVIATHAIAYLTHEFSHSFAAWAFGFMSNPLALDYGGPSPANIVLLAQVGDNVPYDAILSGGHGFAVASIALAGPYVGNALLYIALGVIVGRLDARQIGLASFLFWLMTMCAGNVWSYVPIRAITTHADIAIAASGLNISVWLLFPFLFVPSLVLVAHFLARIAPMLIPVITARRPARLALVVATAATWLFTFFGGVGLFQDYGSVSQAFSLLSAVVLTPLSVIWLWLRCSEAPEP